MCEFRRFDEAYEIVSNKEVCAGYFEINIKADNAAQYCRPGQFFMIQIPGVFLRRPMSIHNVNGDIVSFLYKVTGIGTSVLSKMSSGMINLLGPLGNGYNLKTCKDFDYVIAAGGTGIASVHFLAAKLDRKGTLYYGARSEKDLLCLDKFEKLGWKVEVSTEDGSVGYKGYAVDVLQCRLKTNDVLFACGPMPMLKKISHIARDKKVKGFISLEEKMACGLGNCQGCAVKCGGQNKMVCKDGPVFKIEEIELE
ncbi:MAG: dihydroorotate dehydrogenase electron transfer subunit [Endomicrobium sp.]|nr:dihydroorotate dehydrogenase electron transfer subunit [Endomicrobium sp.]